MEHLITHVEPGSPALRHGLRQGDTLLAINGEEIIDQIDYEALSARRHLILHVRKADGRDWQLELVKPAGIPLGLDFGESMACTPRVCKNKCMFCFIDQMPPACRKTLYVKDDDWRMSLMMGNFITLTNVDDQEFDRILRRRASPLFISVHATDPAVRVKMMKNPDAAKLLPRLRQFKEHGIKFHCQIVLCPGINAGAVLEDTLQTLFSIFILCAPTPRKRPRKCWPSAKNGRIGLWICAASSSFSPRTKCCASPGAISRMRITTRASRRLKTAWV